MLNFLTLSGYDNKLSQKALTSPSTRDFQLIFKFLYSHLDSSFEYGKSFEDDVPLIVKSLRYPFAGDIKASQLRSVGSIHAWPTVLAMLCWMVDLIESIEKMDAEGITESSNEDFKLFYDCISEAYCDFLDGKENYSKIAELEQKFEDRVNSTEEEISAINNLIENSLAQLKEFEEEGKKLPALEKDKQLYISDVEKFKKYIPHLIQKKEKLLESVSHLQEQIHETEISTNEFEEEKADLQAQVDAQQVSPEDIDRMNAECNNLQKILTALNTNKTEINKSIYDREQLIHSRFEILEKIANECNLLAESLELLPVNAKNANGNNFEISLNISGLKLEELTNVDVSFLLKTLQNLKVSLAASAYKANDMLHVLADTIDGLEESACDKQEELEGISEKIKKLTHQYSEEKERFAHENRRAAADLEERQVDILKIRNDAHSASLMSQQLLQKTSIEYDSIRSRIAEEKDRASKEILRIIDDLVTFKGHIEQNLEEFEAALLKEQTNSRSL